MSNELIKAIAIIALELLPTAQWIAQDESGAWYAYEVMPTVKNYSWVDTSEAGTLIKLMRLNRPADFTKEIYEIKAILSRDAIQASLPESEKAKQVVSDMPTNLTQLKELAQRALDLYSDDAQWIAIDSDGDVWAYDLKPTIDETKSNWDNSDYDTFAWKIGKVAPPADYRNEIYEISKLIDND